MLKKIQGGGKNGFKSGNFYGIDNDPTVVALAIVNMIFRGDGSSNIKFGDSLSMDVNKLFTRRDNKKPNKVLMNPPFAKSLEFEWEFVNLALNNMEKNGLLFSVLPTTSMGSSNDERKEITWRKELLKRHTLISVIKLPEQLFKAAKADKGTYGVIIKANKPHQFDKDKVVFGVLDDGVAYSKTKKHTEGNIEQIKNVLKNFLATKTEPDYISQTLDCSLLITDNYDYTPEFYIGRNRENERLNSREMDFVKNNLNDAYFYLQTNTNAPKYYFDKIKWVSLSMFIKEKERGKSGRAKNLSDGNLPLISTSETRNGISCSVDQMKVKKIYPSGCITISANGGSCRAFYHDYEFAANPDVHVCMLKEKYNSKKVGLFLCSIINREKWRYHYYRKFSSDKLEDFKILIPIDEKGNIDINRINSL